MIFPDNFLPERLFPHLRFLQNQTFCQDRIPLLVKNDIQTEQLFVELFGSFYIFYNNHNIFQLHFPVLLLSSIIKDCPPYGKQSFYFLVPSIFLCPGMRRFTGTSCIIISFTFLRISLTLPKLHFPSNTRFRC